MVTPTVVLVVLTLLAVAACLIFLTLGAKGNLSFVIGFRATKLAALVLVAYAIAVSTVLFQTISDNRILTPAIMGFDALFMFIQTMLVFTIGAHASSILDPRLIFVLEVLAMGCFSLILYRLLFAGGARSLHLVMLVGLVCGVLFRSLSGFVQRIVDPNDFVVLQDRMFANFNTIDGTLIAVSAAIVLAASLIGLRLFHTLDVLALGRDAAISLGVDYRRVTMLLLTIVTVLVAVSTALVGPVTFFGLLVANLAYLLVPSARHRHVLPAAVLIAILCLVGGQTVLERVFAFNTALSIIIEFAGGLLFIVILLRGKSR